MAIKVVKREMERMAKRMVKREGEILVLWKSLAEEPGFNAFLNPSSEGARRISIGRLFHRRG